MIIFYLYQIHISISNKRHSAAKLRNDYMKARASVITISPGTIIGENRNRRHAYAYDSI